MPWIYADDAKGAKEIKLIIADHEMQRVAAMLCFTAELHLFESYITDVIKVTLVWRCFECTKNGWKNGNWFYGKLEEKSL
jgi:hypothetical protein